MDENSFNLFQKRAEVVICWVEQVPRRDLQEQEGGRERHQAQARRLWQARNVRNDGKLSHFKCDQMLEWKVAQIFQ